MIHVNLHHCNIFSEDFAQKSAEWLDLYTHFILTLSVFNLECNFCHWCGACIRHGYYLRSYLLSPGDLAGRQVRILRVKCKHCGKTHAILPEEVVPYLPFSAVFIHSVLYQYYARKKPVEAICKHFQIAIPQLYRWKKRFETQKDRYLGALESARYSESDALKWLAERSDYAKEFAGVYLSRTEKMPMQQHANPPNTRRPVFS